MAYSKIKHVESAHKHLAQGRVQQAIAEYQQVLKHEPGDQVTLMTVGDLYVRLGETFQAIDYFARLAQIFVRDGFFTKAIAIYKKIAKLAPEEMKPLEKLAELYVQQGILSEARPLFLQLAEGHLKGGRREQAAALLRKLLEAEPDNLRIQLRLAEIQIAMGQEADAAQTFLVCADRQLTHGDTEEAVKLANRALELAPESVPARLLKARALSSAGKPGEAAKILESLPDLESSDENSEQLLDLYLQEGRADRASELAERALEQDPKRYAMAGKVAMAMLEMDQGDAALALLDLIRKTMSENGDAESIAQMLHTAAAKLPGRLEPHEWLVELYTQVNDAFHLPEALTHLAQTAAATGQFDRAREVYEELVERSPEDVNLRRNFEQVRAHLGLGALPEAEAARVPTTETPAAPHVFEEPPLDEETEHFVSVALTDVDLFASYGLASKAIEMLEKVIERAPRHVPSLEKLLDMYLGEGNNKRTAELAGTLSEILTERGDMANAERFGELYRRYQRAAALDPQPPAAPAEFELPAHQEISERSDESGETLDAHSGLTNQGIQFTETEEEESQEPAAELSGEVDLSEEWDAISGEIIQTSRQTPATEPEDQPVSIEASAAPFVAKHEPAESEKDEPAEYELELVEETEDSQPASVSPIRPAAEPDGGSLGDLALEFGMALDAVAPTAPSAPANGAGRPSPQALAPSEDSIFPAPATPMVAASAPGGPLSEIFNEFRDALDELQMDEDPETHYNLGIAYREMGLLEEAISEFQKVAQAHDSGKAFQYSMQCCTLLALAFMEKGQPEIAAFWYERALKTPGLDQESLLALRYDLGVAQDLAGNADAALKSFQQVYAMNIDYRDVAERIGSLRHS